MLDVFKNADLFIQVGPDGMYLHNTQYGNDEDMDDDGDEDEVVFLFLSQRFSQDIEDG